jgi:peptidyl-prolyl cis-trans isomerase C
MEPGSVRSEPVQTQFGWHVIRLNETRPAEAPALDEVRGELAEQIRQAAVGDRLQALSDAAEIDRSGAESLDPSALSAAGAAQE